MRKILLAALGALVLLACDTDVTQDYTIPYTEQLVLESFICPQDTLIQVRVSKTVPALGVIDPVNNRILTDARVEVSDGTRTVGVPFRTYTLPPNNSTQSVSGYFLKQNEFAIEAGKTYTLTVSTPNGLKATAQCTVPNLHLTAGQVEVKKGTSGSGLNQSQTFQVRVKDFAGTSDRYSAALYRISETRDNTGKVTSRSRNRVLTQYLTDAGLDGDWLSSPKAELSVRPGDSVELYLATTDLAYYEYYKTVEGNRDAQGNPFAEPQPVYSNVQGGLGVFAGYQRILLAFTW